jgi:hypothetical protein
LPVVWIVVRMVLQRVHHVLNQRFFVNATELLHCERRKSVQERRVFVESEKVINLSYHKNLYWSAPIAAD